MRGFSVLIHSYSLEWCVYVVFVVRQVPHNLRPTSTCVRGVEYM